MQSDFIGVIVQACCTLQDLDRERDGINSEDSETCPRVDVEVDEGLTEETTLLC